MPTIGDIINQEILIEGKPTDDPTDKGGRTAFGISERSNPEAWRDGKVTEEEARQIYEYKYITYPRFDKIPFDSLRTQLIDYGVNSGPSIAIQKLQGILHVTVDGIIGPQTLGALNQLTFDDIRWVNNQLVSERVKMLGRIVSNVPSQLKYINGWLSRALEFLV